MSSRNKTDVKKIFEYWCEVTRTHNNEYPPNNNGGDSCDGELAPPSLAVITESFPESYRDEKTIVDIPAFAFPCNFQSDSVQFYSFVLTTDDSKWRFGFCRYDPKSDSTMVMITLLPWHDTFLRLLIALAELRRTDANDFRQFLTEAYNSGVPDLGCQLKLIYNRGHNQFLFERPKQFKLPSIPENHNLNLYYNFVDPKNMIAVFAAMLAERRIIFTSRRLDRLSSCIQAANAFLYPMVWQHIFIPVLPMKLKDYLSAPMPYLIGVPQMVLETMLAEELGEVVILNCDTKIFESPFDDVHSLPNEIVHQLKKQLSHSNQHMGDRVSKIFLGALVQLIGGYRDAVEFREKQKTFNRDKFIESRPSHLRPFLTKMMELQIFQQFIDERLEMINTGLGFSDEFEQETVRYAEKLKKRGRFHYLKEKTNPAVKSAVKSVKESSRVAKHAYKDLKSKFRDITPPHPSNAALFLSHLTSNSQHDRIDSPHSKTAKGHFSAPSSPIFLKRNGCSTTTNTVYTPFAGKSELLNGYGGQQQQQQQQQQLRSEQTTLNFKTTRNSGQQMQPMNGHLASVDPVLYDTSVQLPSTNSSSSPTVSPASSLCSSEMNLSQELQNHPLFKTPIVDRSLKPSYSYSLETNQYRLTTTATAQRTNGPPPARPPPPTQHLLNLYQPPAHMKQHQHQQQQSFTTASSTYSNQSAAVQHAISQTKQLQHRRFLNTSKSLQNVHATLSSHCMPTSTPIPSHNRFMYLSQLDTYDTPPDMPSPPLPCLASNIPPVPPRRQTLTATCSSGGGGGGRIGSTVAATAAAVSAGLNRLERNCWQDYGEMRLLPIDDLRNSSSSSSSSSNTSSTLSCSSGNSFAMIAPAAASYSLSQTSTPPPALPRIQGSNEAPVPAPRFKKDKESLRSLQPQHMMIMGGGSDPTTATSTPNASDGSMKDLISLDDSNNTSFDLEDFDPLNQNARPLPATTTATSTTTTSILTKGQIPNSSSNINSLQQHFPYNGYERTQYLNNRSINNPVYSFYTPQQLLGMPSSAIADNAFEQPPPLPTSVPPPMPPPDEDFELLRKYGLDQFTLNSSNLHSITTTATASAVSSSTLVTLASNTASDSSTKQTRALTAMTTTTGMQNWTTFD